MSGHTTWAELKAERRRRDIEHLTRVLHDATGRVTPDEDDPTPYTTMAEMVYDEVIAPLKKEFTDELASLSLPELFGTEPTGVETQEAGELHRSLRRHPANGHDASTRALISVADDLKRAIDELRSQRPLTSMRRIGHANGLEHALALVGEQLRELGVNRD
jgi:hypothetical protein